MTTTHFIYELAALLESETIALDESTAVKVGRKLEDHFVNSGIITYSSKHQKYLIQMGLIDTLDTLEGELVIAIAHQIPQVTSDVCKTSPAYTAYVNQMIQVVNQVRNYLVRRDILGRVTVTGESKRAYKVYKKGNMIAVSVLALLSFPLAGFLFLSMGAIIFAHIAGLYDELEADSLIIFPIFYGASLLAIISLIIKELVEKIPAEVKHTGYKISSKAIKDYYLSTVTLEKNVKSNVTA